MSMTIFLYRWKIKPGKEKQFEDNWALITNAFLKQCGSYGSRLHTSENGEYLAYAQWPSHDAKATCELSPSSTLASILMLEAVEHTYPAQQFTVMNDMLIFPMNTEKKYLQQNLYL